MTGLANSAEFASAPPSEHAPEPQPDATQAWRHAVPPEPEPKPDHYGGGTPTPQPLRSPWLLRLAGACWIVSGIALVLTPLAAALLVRSQYLSLRRNGYLIANLAEWLDPTDYVRLEPYIVEFERLEAMVLTAPGWLIGLILVCYALAGLFIVAGYLLIGLATARGVDWTRYAGSALAIVSSIIIFQIWQFFAVIAWLPVTALLTNHIGLVAITLQITGVVLAFLPASNSYVKQRRETRREAVGVQVV